MDSLPNEILELIGLHLDLQSLSRLSRAASRYLHVYSDSSFWRSKLQYDYPGHLLDESHQARGMYRDTHLAKVKFYRRFPEYAREAEWVVQHDHSDWRELVAAATINPALIHPAVNRLYQQVKLLAQFIPNTPMSVRLQPRLTTIINETGTIESFPCSDYTNLCFRIHETPERIYRFDLLHPFKRQHLRVGFLVTGLGVFNEEDAMFLFFRGVYVTQANGAKIWYPVADPRYNHEVRLDYN